MEGEIGTTMSDADAPKGSAKSLSGFRKLKTNFAKATALVR